MEPGVWEEVGTAGGAAPQVCTDYPSGTCLALAGERRYMPACLPTSAMAALLPSLSWPAHAHPAPGCEGDPLHSQIICRHCQTCCSILSSEP